MNFFFDYIYYRMTKAYYRWDGRTGATAIIGISFVQAMTISVISTLIIRMKYDRDYTTPYIPLAKWIFTFLLIFLFIINYKKYNGKYNKFRYYWKDESKGKRFYKGLLVILSLMLPLVLAILIGVYW